MIKGAIDRILELSTTEHFVINGRTYTNKGLVPVAEPLPEKLTLNTLTGLADYIQIGTDGLENSESIMLHVVDELTVQLIDPLTDEFLRRPVRAQAQADPCRFRFDNWYTLEAFNIALQSQFVDSPQMAELLKVTGNVTNDTSVTLKDDGVSQEVAAKSGIVTVKNVVLPRQIELKPFSTFAEVDQPARNFVFRMRKNDGEVACALFESDGGRWKLTAIETIRDWLKERLPSVCVIA